MFISFIFVTSGLSKISNYSNTVEWMDAMEVPGGLLPFVIALEVLGGLAIILCWKTRAYPFLLRVFVFFLQSNP